MRLRNRRTADQPVDADGTARCSRCGTAVPVRRDGTCDLGHRVTSPELAAAAAVEPVEPPLHGTPDVAAVEEDTKDKTAPAPAEPTPDDLIADAFGELTFSRPAPLEARSDSDESTPPEGEAPPAAPSPASAAPAAPPPPAAAASPQPAAPDFDRYDLGIGSLSAELADAADDVRAAEEGAPANGVGPHDPSKPPPDDRDPAEDRPAARSLHESAAEPTGEAAGDLGGRTAARGPSGQRTSVALEELLDFGAGAPPSALDDERPSS